MELYLMSLSEKLIFWGWISSSHGRSLDWYYWQQAAHESRKPASRSSAQEEKK